MRLPGYTATANISEGNRPPRVNPPCSDGSMCSMRLNQNSGSEDGLALKSADPGQTHVNRHEAKR